MFGYKEKMEPMSESAIKASGDTVRSVVYEPETRAVIRTELIYQVDTDSSSAGYSPELLEIVANFDNSYIPEGANAISMVGRSKTAEISLRLFARVNDETKILEEVGFGATGTVAEIACASAAASKIKGMTIDQALTVTNKDIDKMVGGVPGAKIIAPHMAEELIRSLVGDYCLRCEVPFGEAEQMIGCSPYSSGCAVCEHCSFRASKVWMK